MHKFYLRFAQANNILDERLQSVLPSTLVLLHHARRNDVPPKATPKIEYFPKLEQNLLKPGRPTSKSCIPVGKFSKLHFG